MKTVVFVPIKLNNERVPGKNVKKFYDGVPLIRVMLDKLIKLDNIDDIYVFCSNESIKEYLIPGVQFLKRPTFLDTKEATPQDIINEFMKKIDADIYMVSHVTSPFVTVEHIQECLTSVQSGKFDSSFTAEKMQRLLWKADNQPLNFIADCIPRTQDIDPIYNEVSAAYVFTKEMFCRLQRRIGEKPHITEVSGVETVDIDYPEDFVIADAIYKEIIKKQI